MIRTHTLVDRILVEDGQAVGVHTAGGETYRAGRAVVASTNPDVLYFELLADADGYRP